MAKARARSDAVDPARLYEAMVFSAYMVEQFGDVYMPILERLEREWQAHVCEASPRERARRILDAHTLDGGLKAIR